MNMFLNNYFHMAYAALVHWIMYPEYWEKAFLTVSAKQRWKRLPVVRALRVGGSVSTSLCAHKVTGALMGAVYELIFLPGPWGHPGRGPGWVISLPCAQLREDLEIVWWIDWHEPRDSGGRWETPKSKVFWGWISSGKGIVAEMSWPGFYPQWEISVLPYL